MKKSAFLINTARGAVIDEQDLAIALKRKTIAGVGLDVFENEPLRKSPLVAMKAGVVLLPHIGSADRITRSKMAEVAAKNIVDVVINKREPERRFQVNPQLKR
jgi:lactate dehydrogenase-like 2-hydroxyacid dehydrogenase